MTSLSEKQASILIEMRGTVPKHGGPLTPRMPNAPIKSVERWMSVNKNSALMKSYHFDEFETRNRFVRELLDHEAETGHHAMMQIHGDRPVVSLTLSTPGIDVITEFDKEYARFADVVFRDVTYNP